ncbi:MAG: glycosyltransferase family 4 protein [Planctomycetaceae bacterium]|nr:glycosyltransferase family 4 protein [Planctomycetaceae bacterium]
MNVVHFITRLIIGGAQENTLLTVEDQHRDYGDKVSLITGPGLGPEGSLEERARNGGYPLHVLPRLFRHISPSDDWASFREFIRLLRAIEPDVVHTHSGKAGILGRAAAAKLRIPVVHTIHGPSFFRGQSAVPYQMYLRAERWAGRRTDRFIGVCDAMTDQYVDACVAPRERFITIYSGMEVEPFFSPPRTPDEVRSELDIPSDAVVIGKIARLFPLKGHEFLLKIAPELVRRHPNILFLFVGDGILRGDFEKRIAAAGLQSHFRFTGLVLPGRVPELVNAMDIVVHTSLREGLARVLPQGLIAGKPVVSYDVDGAREVCINDETGFLLPPESTTELADALSKLIADPALRKRLGETGRRRFTETFRHETMTRRIREVYTEVLKSQTNSPLPRERGRG